MIASVKGPLLRQGAGYLVVDVGGMGMRVEVPSGARSPSIHSRDVFLHTSLIVREDALTLFGFETLEEIEVFEHMITVSGVGPKSALGVLSAMTPGEIAQAVMREDDKAFRQVPGIGPKTAKLLIVSLAGKLDHLPTTPAQPGEPVSEGGAKSQVLLGLQGLGWSQTEAERAMSAALEAGSASDAAGLLRAALKILQAGQGGLRR